MNHRTPRGPKADSPDTTDSENQTLVWRRQGKQEDRDILCYVKDMCGTCRYINNDYRESLDHKYKAQLKRFSKLDAFASVRLTAPTPAPQTDHYRCHAKLGVRIADECVNPAANENFRFKIGLFQSNSRKLLDLNTCPLHRHSIENLITDLRPILEETELQPYSEKHKSGDIRHIAVRAAHLTSEIMVTFVCTSDIRQPLKNIMSALRMKGHNVSAAYMNLNSPEGQDIFGEDNIHIAGSQRLRETSCGIEFSISPTAYYQVNPSQAEFLWRRVGSLAGEDNPGECAWDLYSGVGTISLVLAEQGFQVLGIEENPNSVRDAQFNTQKVAPERSPFFLCGRTEDQTVMLPAWARDPRVIVANPSRKGISESVRSLITDTIKESDKRRFIYVSSDSISLARDIKEMTKTGLKLKQLEAFDMFPYTEKLEWVAVVTG